MKNLVTSAAILASLAVVGGASAAQAFDFKTNYTAALEGSNKWKGDLTLDSVEFGGQTYTDFAFAQRTKIVSNDVWGGGNSGAASADMGDLVDIAGLENRSFREAGSAEALTLALGNNNLNSIVDTEDKGNFAIDVLFDTAVDNVLVWERGRNSALDVQAIGKDGNVVGNLLALGKSNKGGWSNAGFSLNTKEIGGTQKVASIGVSLADLGLT
ncbi:MAG: exosortase-dependent surface protein XDP2, partial [Spirulinaceae cyanobacterium]